MEERKCEFDRCKKKSKKFEFKIVSLIDNVSCSYFHDENCLLDWLLYTLGIPIPKEI